MCRFTKANCSSQRIPRPPPQTRRIYLNVVVLAHTKAPRMESSLPAGFSTKTNSLNVGVLKNRCSDLARQPHITGTEALAAVIPHKGTTPGAVARTQGLGCGVAVPNTHTRTGSSKTKGKKQVQIIPMWLRKLQQYPFGMWGNACN